MTCGRAAWLALGPVGRHIWAAGQPTSPEKSTERGTLLPRGTLCPIGTHRLLLDGAEVGCVDRLAEAKVGQLHVAIPREQQVVRLDVPVDVAVLVDGVDRGNGLGNVEAGLLLGNRKGTRQQCRGSGRAGRGDGRQWQGRQAGAVRGAVPTKTRRSRPAHESAGDASPPKECPSS